MVLSKLENNCSAENGNGWNPPSMRKMDVPCKPIFAAGGSRKNVLCLNTLHFRICTFLVDVPARVVAQLQHGMLTSALAGSISPSALADMSRVSMEIVVAERGFVQWLPSRLIACVHMMIVTFANILILGSTVGTTVLACCITLVHTMFCIYFPQQHA